jgi:uncharacterized protein YaiI (UPF0178 family)
LRYRSRVALERPTEIRSPKAAVRFEYETIEGLDAVPATIVPATIETRLPDHVAIEDRYDVVLAGRHLELRAQDAVVDGDGRRFEIETIAPLLGERQTRLTARLVTAPTTAAGS